MRLNTWNNNTQSKKTKTKKKHECGIFFSFINDGTLRRLRENIH
jgi:hypothetical protein